MTISKTVDLETFCRSIINLERNVSSIVVIDQKGKPIEMVTQQKLIQPIFEKWNDIHFMECSFEISMGGKSDDLYGPIRYHYSDKDNFIMFSFPFDKNVLLVTCSKKVSPIAFATKVSHRINEVIDEMIRGN